MRFRFILSSGLAAVLLWSFYANTQQETARVNTQLRAASHHTQWLSLAIEQANARAHEPSEDIGGAMSNLTGPLSPPALIHARP